MLQEFMYTNESKTPAFKLLSDWMCHISRHLIHVQEFQKGKVRNGNQKSHYATLKQ